MSSLFTTHRKSLSLGLAVVLFLFYGLTIRIPLQGLRLALFIIFPLVLVTWGWGRRASWIASAAAIAYGLTVLAVDQLFVHHNSPSLYLLFLIVTAAAITLVVPRVFGRLHEANIMLRSATAALQGISTHHDALLNALPDLMVELDREGTIYSFHHSSHYQLLFPLTGSPVGRSIREFLPGETADSILSAVSRAAESGYHRSAPFLATGDRGSMWYELSISAVGDHRDARCHYVVLERDVTDRQTAENALRESEAHYRNVFRHAPFGYFRSTADGKLLVANPTLASLYRYESPEAMVDEVNSSGVAEALYENPQDRRSIVESVTSKETWEEFFTSSRRKDGTLFTAKMFARANRSAGQGMELEGFIEDITEKEKVQAELANSNAHYRAVMDALPDIYFELDRQGRYFDVNGRTENMLLATKEDIIGRSVAEVLPAEAAGRILDALSRAAHLGRTVSARFSIPGKKGVVHREASIAPIGDTADPDCHFVELARDITDRVALQEQLVQAQKMEAVGRLAGGIAHDFNNILQIILGFSELIDQHPEDRENVIKDLAIIRQSAGQAAELTRQLLAFSRKQTADLKTVNVSELVSRMLPILRRTLGEDVGLEAGIDDPGVFIKADEGQLQQVLMNLAVNSRDAMPAGGSLTVEIRKVVIAEGAAGGEPHPGPYALITVADTGSGMTSEVASHMFEPFFTTKEQGKGTGLGLSIVYAIVRQFGGSISVQSEVGKGTSFFLYFPLAPSELPAGDTGVLKPPQPGGTETILMAEDERSIRDYVERALQAKGYRVIVATDGAEALSTIRSKDVRIDLLLTDLVMPGARGDLVAAELRKVFPDAAVVFMSGYSGQAVPAGGEERSALFLQKPFSVGELLTAIRSALDSRSVRDGEPR